MGDERPLTRVLRDLPEGRTVTLGGLLSAIGPREHGAALLFLSLPEALPAPLPSVSVILGMPLVLISAYLALFGEAGALPQRLCDQPLPPRLLAALRGRVAPLLDRAERLSHSRWPRLAEQEWLLGLVCLSLSVLLLLPLPFFNVPPALCLVLLAWGMVQRDGVVVAAGLAGTAAMTALLVGLLGTAGPLLE
jgi:hypothetical protein